MLKNRNRKTGSDNRLGLILPSSHNKIERNKARPQPLSYHFFPLSVSKKNRIFVGEIHNIMKYPIGIQSLEDIINNGFVYVDKTDLVYKLATEGKVYFLSRPRRFGKSLLMSTLENYFLGRKELFLGLKIDALEKDWIEYPVFTLSFGKSNFMQKNNLEDAIEDFLLQAEKQYNVVPEVKSYGVRFANVLKAAHEQTGRQAVVLIDEYDKPLLDVMELDHYVMDGNDNKVGLEDYNRGILKGFYGVFKDADKHLRFVMLTGVTKFSQVSVFSGFNQPQDISMDSRYEALCGITTDELLTVFDEPIRELAEKNKVSYDEIIGRLKRRYDGYHFSEEMIDIYNPFSLLNCFASMRMRDYWFASGTPTYLMRLLQHSDENINEFIGRYYDCSEFVNYKADVQKPLPMIYQSGYLTIKDYDDSTETYRLDFPNQEVSAGFIDMLASDYFKENREQTTWIREVTMCLRDGNVERFMELMKAQLASISYEFQRKDDDKECERYYQYTFYLILMLTSKFYTIAERHTSNGRIDCVISTPQYIYIMEFKLNGSAKEAIQQIEDKDYVAPYRASGKQIICLGINFSSETGTINEYESRTLNSL